jgi:hypothetical protein
MTQAMPKKYPRSLIMLGYRYSKSSIGAGGIIASDRAIYTLRAAYSMRGTATSRFRLSGQKHSRE